MGARGHKDVPSWSGWSPQSPPGSGPASRRVLLRYPAPVRARAGGTKATRKQEESGRRGAGLAGPDQPLGAKPGTLSILFTLPPLTFSLCSAVRFIPASYRSGKVLQLSPGNTGAPRPKAGVNVLFLPRQWEPPGQRRLHRRGTTALLYRASRRVLNPAGSLPARPCGRSICSPARLTPVHDMFQN